MTTTTTTLAMHQAHLMYLRMNPIQKPARTQTPTPMATLEVQVQVQKPPKENGILQLGE